MFRSSLNNRISNEEKIRNYIIKNKIPTEETIQTDRVGLLNKSKLSEGVKYIIVPNLSILGNTSFKVLKYIIKQVLEEGRSLHIVDDDIIIDRDHMGSINLIYALFQIERQYVVNRVNISKATRTRNKSKLGRKKGKKVKSMFDKHKAKIKRLYNSKCSIKEISDAIDVGTAQALGRYIKKNNLAAENEMDNLKGIITRGF